MSRRGIDLSNLRIKDLGNITTYPLDEARTRQSIKNSLSFILESTKAPLICIGGDHSIAFPEMQAYSRLGKIGVVWIDAHRDLLDELYGSKYSHGSPLRRAIEEESILPENVLLIGTRYFTSSETHFLEENDIAEIKMVNIEEARDARYEIKSKMEELAKFVDHIFLSIDIDGIDPAYAPGTGYPVAGGISASLLLNIIHDFPVPIRGVDIVEVSPSLDHSNVTMKLLMAIITELCAKVKN
jgi:agmatinase